MARSAPLAAILLVAACATAGPAPSELRAQVQATERAFARTMADRDHAAFTSFLSEEAIFLGGRRTLRGKAEVAAAWKALYQQPAAPFSWEPDTVEVLRSGTLALTQGPVRDPAGRLVGRFSSVWRREAPGTWRIVLDHGCDVCEACRP